MTRAAAGPLLRPLTHRFTLIRAQEKQPLRPEDLITENSEKEKGETRRWNTAGSKPARWGGVVCARADGAGPTGGRARASGRGGDVPQVFVACVRYAGCSCAVAGAPFGGRRVADPEENHPPLSRRFRLHSPVGDPRGTRRRCALTRKLKVGCVR